MWLSFYVLAMPLLLLVNCLQLLFPAGTVEDTQAVYIFLNIYFIENKDRYLIISSHKPSDLGFQAGAFLVVFTDLTHECFCTTDSFL